MQIPTVDSVPRPTELLKKLPAHYLILRFDAFPARIQCSHEPTLVFLAEYLDKHGRTNDNDPERRNLLKFSLIDAKFAHSHQDTLTIGSYVDIRVNAINPTIISALVEGVLGYKRVENVGKTLVFHQDRGFA